ncbi:MAG: chemotaxis response regulator protein-glutamate methylesterase [Candidatus Kapabacteria bacterium]|jgi:two-component system chemotaxis response regulator CheB|nr:chemotaxis response regulator protein-glutamate methylesterase [Candidatus Kapabacteria bacterium]
MTKKVRVLIVDDSALVRDILAQGLGADPNIEVVGTAQDPFVARDKIVELRPDVLTLDVEMPRMDGVEFLRRLMPQYPLPVVMVSSLTQRGKEITMQALEAGAVDFVAKPTSNVAQGLQSMMFELRTKVKIASTANVAHWKNKREELFNAMGKSAVSPSAGTGTPLIAKSAALSESTDKVIAIGSSTGGTEALRKVLRNLPATMPGIVITQHMPAGFTKTFADRLNDECEMQVVEAANGDRVMNGKILIAPGDMHMKINRSGGRYEIALSQEEKVNGHRPSVDVMMRSVAQNVGRNAIGVILTGMGSDGALGLKAMLDAGAMTLAQDEASSVVYGMPKAAFEAGAVKKVVSLDVMAENIFNALKGS